VGARAEALEKAAKEGNYEFVAANNKGFIEAAEELIRSLNERLAKMIVVQPRPKKEKPDAEALSKLFTACENFNIADADTSMAEIESFEYKAGGSLAAWLRENVNQMNFAEIREKLSGENDGKYPS
jgi:predicted TIM-barrel fold metal-dependent hydrolase